MLARIIYRWELFHLQSIMINVFKNISMIPTTYLQIASLEVSSIFQRTFINDTTTKYWIIRFLAQNQKLPLGTESNTMTISMSFCLITFLWKFCIPVIFTLRNQLRSPSYFRAFVLQLPYIHFHSYSKHLWTIISKRTFSNTCFA